MYAYGVVGAGQGGGGLGEDGGVRGDIEVAFLRVLLVVEADAVDDGGVGEGAEELSTWWG